MVGNSFGGAIALRIATQHPDRVDKLVLMGSVGVDFPITEGLDGVWGYDGVVREHEGDDRLLRLRPVPDHRRAGRRCATGRSTQPGFQESYAAMFPAPRQRWVDAMVAPDEEIRSCRTAR